MFRNVFRPLLLVLLCQGVFLSELFAQHDPPVVVNDTVYMNFGEKRWVNLLANDYDPDGLILKLFNSPFAVKTDSAVLVDLTAYRYMSFAGTVRFRYIVRQYSTSGNPGRIGTGLLIVYLSNKGVDSLSNSRINACLSVADGQFVMYSDQSVMPGEEIDPGGVCTYNYPVGNSLATLYTMSLWLGGLDAGNQLHFSGERYRKKGSDFWAGPLFQRGDTVAIDTTDVFAFHRIWHITANEILRHITHCHSPGYEVPSEIAEWPAHGDTTKGQSRYLAPFVDTDGNGVYEPLAGDYPLIRGDEAVWFVINDYRTSGRESGKSKYFGIEIHCMAYVFHSENDSSLTNTVFFHYKIINRSLNDYHQVYLGVFADFDIGYPDDDFVKCDVKRGSMIGYNGDAIDGDDDVPGYGDNPPAQSVTILAGPLLNPDGVDNQPGGCDNSINGSGFGDGKADNERIGMSRFIYFNNGVAGYMSDPDSATDYYNYMRGVWLDGSMVEYGGNGHYSTGAYGPSCRYMYPDESDPVWYGTACEPPFGPVKWTEEIAGNQPGDRRGLATMGAVDLPAGGLQLLDLALVTGRGSGGQSSLGVLAERIDTIRQRFLKDPDFFGLNLSLAAPERSGSVEIKVFPNPANDFLRARLPETYKKYVIRNSLGQVCQTGMVPVDGQIRIEELYSGFYVITFEGISHSLIARFLKL